MMSHLRFLELKRAIGEWMSPFECWLYDAVSPDDGERRLEVRVVDVPQECCYETCKDLIRFLLLSDVSDDKWAVFVHPPCEKDSVLEMLGEPAERVLAVPTRTRAQSDHLSGRAFASWDVCVPTEDLGGWLHNAPIHGSTVVWGSVLVQAVRFFGHSEPDLGVIADAYKIPHDDAVYWREYLEPTRATWEDRRGAAGKTLERIPDRYFSLAA